MFYHSRRGRKSNEVACIFVHAGAGYHSVQNESVHLQACNDAAKAAMYIMKNSGSAVDAVEVAVKVLEDREITNAGYGSNLTMDGVVECDAIVVDNYGRSGAVGAVAQIKNPVSLARLVLDHTTQTLSLRRVPPNLLVGQGATDFAYELGMPILPHDCLISPAAKERWRRWRDDLEREERNRRQKELEFHHSLPETPQAYQPQPYNFANESEQMRRAHTNAMRAGVWNEAQPLSPPPPNDKERDDVASSSPSKTTSSTSVGLSDETSLTTPELVEDYMDPNGPPGMLEDPFKNSPEHDVQNMSSTSLFAAHGSSDGGGLIWHPEWNIDMEFHDVLQQSDEGFIQMVPPTRQTIWHDGSSGSGPDSTRGSMNLALGRARPKADHDQDQHSAPPHGALSGMRREITTPTSRTPVSSATDALPSPSDANTLHAGSSEDEDNITDTVGAIAIDIYGNIACAASSGGIGMKHRGRIGPAALVGIGAAVLPTDEADPDRTTVATVTSGTGEHMGTTNASITCSDRVYRSVRKAPGGAYQTCSEDEALNAFIQKDFMDHPSVKQSHSSGAIGILSVKKTKDGAYLFFGHNTDSFALASMHSDESKPVCTMSRSKGNGVIAQGGRAIRYKKRKG